MISTKSEFDVEHSVFCVWYIDPSVLWSSSRSGVTDPSIQQWNLSVLSVVVTRLSIINYHNYQAQRTVTHKSFILPCNTFLRQSSSIEFINFSSRILLRKKLTLKQMAFDCDDGWQGWNQRILFWTKSILTILLSHPQSIQKSPIIKIIHVLTVIRSDF